MSQPLPNTYFRTRQTKPTIPQVQVNPLLGYVMYKILYNLRHTEALWQSPPAT